MATIDRDQLLARVDLGTVLDALCGPRTSHGRWHCPDREHADAHPSVTIRTTHTGTQTWRCWSQGHRGTAIDAVMAHHRVGVRDAIVWLADHYAHLPICERPPELPRRPAGDPDHHVVHYIESAAKLLWTAAGTPQRDWLHQRGLGDDVLRVNGVGADPGRRLLGRPARGFPAGWPAVVYPACDRAGRPVFFQARYLDPPAHRAKYDNPAGQWASNPRLAWTTPPGHATDGVIVVCEGIPDALIAAQAGLRAVGVLGTWAADQHTATELADAATTSQCTLVVCFDGDDAGRASADRLRTTLATIGVPMIAVTPPAGEDVTTWAAHDPEWAAHVVGVVPTPPMRRPTPRPVATAGTDHVDGLAMSLGAPNLR